MPKASDLGVVSVEECMRTVYRLEFESSGRELKFLCPNPAHPETNPSCSVNEETGYFHCFSCGIGGDLAELGTYVLRLPRSDVLEMLQPHSHEGMLQVIRNKLSTRSVVRTLAREDAPVPPGPYDDGPLTSLRARGFTDETLQRWGVRFVEEQQLQGSKGPFTLRASVGIPIRDEHERLLAWCYRRTSSSAFWQPRYLYSNDVRDVWFGMQHHARADEVVIVEGALDAMWLDQCGYPALGLLGSGMTGGKKVRYSKVMRLQNYKSIVLLGDRDQGGLSWVRTVGEALGERMPVRVATYRKWMPAGDPAELMGVDLELMLASAKPWLRWAHSA